jgi:hypothetical protein
MSKWTASVPLLVLLAACGAPDPSRTESEIRASTALDEDDATDESEEALESRDRCKPKLPNRGLLATFHVVDEVFHSLITNEAGMQQAIDLWQGRSAANIPVGRLVCKRRRYNCPYTWHQDPSTVEFAEFAIEVCDGLPSFVEADCPSFGAGQFCPFAAELTLLRDCRKSHRCPTVPR